MRMEESGHTQLAVPCTRQPQCRSSSSRIYLFLLLIVLHNDGNHYSAHVAVFDLIIMYCNSITK